MNQSTVLKALAVALAAVAAVSAAAVPSYAADPVVQTTSGLLRGTVEEGHRSFQGVPYAAPPVGDLRWRATEPVQPWSGIRDATAPGSQCPQPGTSAEVPVAGSEDCLYLNVHAPLETAEPVPVMVYVHGGGLVDGEGAFFDPTRLVEQSHVIVVTVNYRLGALGFLAHPGLDDPWAGNFGLADQQEALRWVEANISGFGGDPGNVTVWGQSAGGFAVCAHLASPIADGLFDKAIVQSASCGIDVLDVETAENRGVSLAAELGCTDPDHAIACLHQADLADLVSWRVDQVGQVTRHHRDYPWFPVAGTPPLPDQPLRALWHGAAADVPLIHGATTDEARLMVLNTYIRHDSEVTADDYPAIIADLFGHPTAGIVLHKYPLSEYPNPSLALATVLTDYGGVVGTCSQLPALTAAARHTTVYAYEFAQPVDDDTADFPLGAIHGADTSYFFETPYSPTPPTGDQRALADTLTNYWGTFAHTGDPTTDWHPYHHHNAHSFAVDAIGPIDITAGHHCRFWIPRL